MLLRAMARSSRRRNHLPATPLWRIASDFRTATPRSHPSAQKRHLSIEMEAPEERALASSIRSCADSPRPFRNLVGWRSELSSPTSYQALDRLLAPARKASQHAGCRTTRSCPCVGWIFSASLSPQKQRRSHRLRREGGG